MKNNIIIGLLLVIFAGVILTSGCGTIDKHQTPQGEKASIRELDRSKKTAIITSFKHDKVLAGEDIQVKVINLEVTLTGKVETQEDKDRAGKIAMGIPGIKKVDNKLEIR